LWCFSTRLRLQNVAEVAQPKQLTISLSGGFETPQDKSIFSGDWGLHRFPGSHSLCTACPSKLELVLICLPHLEDVNLSNKVVSSISSIKRCDSILLVTGRIGAVAAWKCGNACPISNFIINLV
ncbi:hypothetical protein TSMEX_003295, partial [Taenia solium]